MLIELTVGDNKKNQICPLMYKFNIIRTLFIYTFITNIVSLLKSWFEGVLFFSWVSVYLTIILQAQMGSESIAIEE